MQDQADLGAYLPGEQLIRMPGLQSTPIGASTLRAKPVTEVGGDGVEITAQAVSREGGVAVRPQAHIDIVYESYGIFVFAMTQVKRWQDLGDRIDR
jgi:hypothetical protein